MVSLHFLLFRRSLPGEHDSALCERSLGGAVPEPFRHAPRSRVVVGDDQRRLGNVQPGRRLSFGRSCRPIRLAKDETRSRVGIGRVDHVAYVGAFIRQISWRRSLNSVI